MNARKATEFVQIAWKLFCLGALVAAYGFLIYGYYVYMPWRQLFH